MKWTNREKAVSEDDINNKVITWAEHKQNLKKVAYDMMKEGGKDINDILDMPFSFLWMLLKMVGSQPNQSIKKTAC
ncbi:hypothetical protein KVY09_08130 [Staphylococcus haemolyticus]|nr:hypothetical protein [Staphylococcus haemolyticus]QXN79035.1 hypothetical protein KVY09_08130 [Staphylococcus haemolyticus]